jgi:hypothetical protein
MSEKAVSNGDDSTESTEYSSVAIGVNMPPLWVDAAGRISTRPGPFQVGGPEVLDAASFVSYDSAAPATIGLDGLGTSDIGHRELPSDSVLTRATDSGGSSVALGTSGSGNGPIWVNGPDIGGNVQMKVPVDGSLNRPADRGTTSVALGSSGEAQPAYTAIGTNGHLMHGVHFRAHDHHHHRAKTSAGAPSIAGISDVSQSAGHHSHHTNTIKNSVPTMIGFGHAGDLIFVFDGRLQIGSTTVHADGTWVFTTPALLNGRHDFSVGTINPESGAMQTSNHLGVRVFAEASHAPTAIATITSAIDEVTDPGGHTHQVAMENGSKTSDASPKLVGTLSAALQAGEVLYVYRDGQRMGKADVSGNGWSFQDGDVASGKHVYTAQVESTSGVHGVASGEFALIKEATFNDRYLFPILATEDYLIIDIRLLAGNSRSGQPAAFDFEESVRFMKRDGLDVESYTQTNDFISFKVDWMGYAATHPWDYISLISHDHVDNANGGLDYYNSWGTPLFSSLLNNLGRWTNLMYFMDGAALQSPQPPVDVHITGIYDDVLAPNGESIHTLIPEGGATSNSTHTLVGTLSGPIPRGGGDVVIYRDGVKIAANMFGFRWVTVSGTEWTFEDRDVPPGTHVYTAQIERWYGKQGAISESYSILEAGPIPMAVATITSALDEFTDPSGNHHQTVIENGSKTLDTSPRLLGSLSATLLDGEALYVYRDGIKLGHADVSGDTWSFQDGGVAIGSHTYTARVESSSGAQGPLTSNFSLIEASGGEFEKLPLLVTEHFLILDVRAVNWVTASGKPMVPDLTETVNGLNKLGLAAKVNSTSDGYISIEIDWTAYAETHPGDRIDFVLNLHIDNDSGGLNYYKSINVPSFGNLLKVIDTWVPTNFMADGAEWQSATPAPATVITGVYDSYIGADGKPQLMFVPDGGGTAASTHRIEGTLSEPMRMASDWLLIYRDGVKLPGQANAFERGTYSNTTWWFVDTDVPPGPHVYTARVERAYGKQGDWSDSYGVLNANAEPVPDALPPLLMLTDGALIVDVHALTPPNAGGSAASLGLSAELIAGGKTVAVLAVTADAGGLVSFAADWKAVAATHPDATLQISAHNGPDDTATILDKHALSSLLGQTDRWVSMTSTGESAAFFDASDRGAHIHGGAGVNTLAIADDHQLIDLTSLTGKTAASTIMGVEKIDLGGQHNTLKIAMIDVLNLGETDLFRIDGKQQLMVNGKAGDSVKLSNTRVAGIADGEWEQQAETQIGGVTYNIYEHSTAHVELMVQSGVQLTML